MAENDEVFTSVLQRLLDVHQAQINALTQRLEEERRERKELEQRVASLRRANEDASKLVRQAKEKIKQQARIIKELRNKGPGECDIPPSTQSQLTTPTRAGGVATPPPTSERTNGGRLLNQTCAALFESPAGGTVNKSLVGVTSQEEAEATGEAAGEGGVDYHRGESVETVAGDVIVVEGDDDKQPAPSPSRPDLDKLDKSTSHDVLETSLHPPGAVHMIYSHAHTCNKVVSPFQDGSSLSSGSRTSHNTSLSGSRPLSLREGAAGKVKWKEISSSPVSASTSSTNSSATCLSPSPTKLSSPPHDSDSDPASSPEQLSPSLLRASNSPWKLQRSNQSAATPAPVSASPSLFPRTPAAGYTDVVITTPISSLKPAIPQSDSQFSLDVSQSIPPSPELCPQVNGAPIPTKQLVRCAGLPSTSVTPHSVGRCVVPITPGVLSVDKILRGEERWRAVSGHSGVTAGKVNLLTGKREAERVDFEDEDILPQSKVHKLDGPAALMVDDDQTMLQEETDMASPEPVDEEEEESAVSPLLLYHTSSVTSRKNGSTHTAATSRDEQTAKAETPHIQQMKHDQQRLMLERAGLPTGFKYDAVVRRKADRDKLQGKACPDCKAWFTKGDGIHDDVESHLKHTCRHKHLHLPPDEDSRLWNISFPATEECDKIMDMK